MQEQLLQYIWQFQLFNSTHLQTANGEDLQILHAGQLNQHAGPDFTQAKIKIADTIWVGNVEIHIHEKDWFQHNHQENKAYNNVILHVVFERNQKQTHLPTLVLQDRIPKHLLQTYEQLMQNQLFIPCEKSAKGIEPIYWQTVKQRMLAERLELKSERIQKRLVQTKNDWNQVFYEQLAYNFGLSTNAQNFEQLAQRLPLKLLRKYHNNYLQIEALLFGVAGFLTEELDDRYPQQLQAEFQFLQQKHQLVPLQVTQWNFGRIRPPSFPTVRLAQFSRLIFQSKALFSKLMEVKTVKEIQQLFQVEPVDYWKTHYHFKAESQPKSKTISNNFIQSIIINTIAPFQFIVGNLKQDEALQENAIQLLEQLPKERNSITKQWEQLGVTNKSAGQSQALLHLYKNYCQPKLCLHCSIGHCVLKRSQ